LYSIGSKKRLSTTRNGALSANLNGKMCASCKTKNFYVRCMKIDGKIVILREIMRRNSIIDKEKYKNIQAMRTDQNSQRR
jgi:hypothetical protein